MLTDYSIIQPLLKKKMVDCSESVFVLKKNTFFINKEDERTFTNHNQAIIMKYKYIL